MLRKLEKYMDTVCTVFLFGTAAYFIGQLVYAWWLGRFDLVGR